MLCDCPPAVPHPCHTAGLQSCSRSSVLPRTTLHYSSTLCTHTHPHNPPYLSHVTLQDGSSDVHSWEVRLVQEFCDLGSLRDVLNSRKGLRQQGEASAIDLLAVLDTALDVARAMAHLHTENIVHSDLKARNVLLKSAATDTRGFLAKVADFGLSLKIDAGDTHISNAYQVCTKAPCGAWCNACASMMPQDRASGSG